MMQIQCPRCGAVFDTREVESQAKHEQATAAPGELRTVIRSPAWMVEEEGPNAGGSDDYC